MLTTYYREEFEGDFYEEENIPENLRAKNLDYINTGYDRGHLAAAANHKISFCAYEQTFSLANIAPQVNNSFTS